MKKGHGYRCHVLGAGEESSESVLGVGRVRDGVPEVDHHDIPYINTQLSTLFSSSLEAFLKQVPDGLIFFTDISFNVKVVPVNLFFLAKCVVLSVL